MRDQASMSIAPGTRRGHPCICGLRITVDEVLASLASGLSAPDIMDDSPDLTPADMRAHGVSRASKDDDGQQLSVLDGALPHVGWGRRRTCTTADIEHAWRRQQTDVLHGDAHEAGACLIVGRRRA